MELYNRILNLRGVSVTDAESVQKFEEGVEEHVVFKETMYAIANKTVPVHSVNKITKQNPSGISKLKEYGLCQGCPVKVIGLFKKFLMIRSFHVDTENSHLVPLNKITDYLCEATIVNDNEIIAPSYPVNIPLIELEVHALKVKKMQGLIEKMVKSPTCDPKVKKIIEDKLFQMMQTQGAPYVKMTEIENYLNGNKVLSKNERFGNSIFNRNSRYCPPIDISYDEFKKSPSYPYPIGIRPKDFALPSELIETLKELMTQIYNFENIDKKSFEPLKEIIDLKERPLHICKYSGEVVDANKYSSTYASENNYIEICHRDPNDRFLARNMYWGNGESNRRQGGYSEEDRIKDAIRLLQVHKEHLDNFRCDLEQLIK